MPPRPKSQIEAAERRLAKSQQLLEKLHRQEERARRAVELEMQRLDALRSEQSVRNTEFGMVEPNLSAPSPFRSQFGLDSESGGALSFGPADILNADALPVQNPLENVPSSNQTDGRNFDVLVSDPGQKVYISGYYLSSGAGSKRYEYEVESSLLMGGLQVGDQIEVPVHARGHNDGRLLSGHDRRYIVEAIYTNPRFTEYHDVARG